MATFFEVPGGLESLAPFIRVLITIGVAFVIISFILRHVKKSLLKKAKTKNQISNVNIFISILKYALFLLLLLIAIFSYSGSFTSLGLMIGLFSAALGFALQKPISGIAAWIVIATKRPFQIGDRVLIGDVKGDVKSISFAHIYLKEVGGRFPAEEKSGRIVMIPNHFIFEKNIVNYSLRHDYVMDQVTVAITYESDMNKAIRIALDSAKKFVKNPKKEAYIRLAFKPSGIDVQVRYYVTFGKLDEISTSVTKEMHDRITKTKSVEIAYPHTEVVFRKK